MKKENVLPLKKMMLSDSQVHGIKACLNRVVFRTLLDRLPFKILSFVSMSRPKPLCSLNPHLLAEAFT